VSYSACSLYCFDDLENAYDYPEHVGRLAGLLREARADGAFLLGAGDDTALGTLPILAEEAGRGLAEPFFEAVAHDAETFGNHDLDFGWEWAREWAERVPPTYCCANLDAPDADAPDADAPDGDAPDGDAPDADEIPNHTILERDGVRLGVVGVAHPNTDEIAVVLEECSFSDPVAAAREELHQLRERGVDHTVVLSHGGEHDRRIAAETDADAVAGGHAHDEVATVVDGTALVRTGGSEIVAEVRLHDGAPPEIVTHDVAEAPLDESVRETYRDLRSAVGADEPVTTLSEPIRRTREVRAHGESRVGNFLADAISVAVEADAALFPAGSLRDGPALSGEVTVGDVVSLCPFDDTVRELSLSGEQLRAVLAECWGGHAGKRQIHVHVAGLRVRWDDDGSVASVRVQGEPLDPEETYSVAVTGWFVVTDSYYPADEEHVVRADVSLIDTLIEHARNGGLDAATCEGRISRE
jgi:2',3'-cyclic-nucleotide 2'-phosphodiesterase (5'-nucleotidase family)